MAFKARYLAAIFANCGKLLVAFGTRCLPVSPGLVVARIRHWRSGPAASQVATASIPRRQIVWNVADILR
jgi:hypothetical protein